MGAAQPIQSAQHSMLPHNVNFIQTKNTITSILNAVMNVSFCTSFCIQNRSDYVTVFTVKISKHNVYGSLNGNNVAHSKFVLTETFFGFHTSAPKTVNVNKYSDTYEIIQSHLIAVFVIDSPKSHIRHFTHCSIRFFW